MESTRNYRKIQLVFDMKKLQKLTRKAEYIDHKIFHENLVAVELTNTEVFLNKPIYSGFAVLELSKAIMYRFHYEVSSLLPLSIPISYCSLPFIIIVF